MVCQIEITETFLVICCDKPVFVCAVGMQSGSLKLFTNIEQKPMLLKRQAFAMFSGELDQYHLYLPLIQGVVLFLDIYVDFYVIMFNLVVETDNLCSLTIIKLLSACFQSVSLRLCV